jgi:putative Mg2+ transporter-C (MgtC) family protein
MPSSALEMMPLYPSWMDISIRIVLVIAAGALIGLNRQAGGHAAGLRTTVLVGLAACLAMIQANVLLSVAGKTEHSFAVMDTLRFPLGVLTGVGFIGGGAILKRGDLVTGVTTAATLWVMTAIGLCIGGGQLVIGCAGTIAAFVVLAPFKLLDERVPSQQKARLVVEIPANSAIPDIAGLLKSSGCRTAFIAKETNDPGDTTWITFELQWKHLGTGGGALDLLAAVEARHKIAAFEVLNAAV